MVLDTQKLDGGRTGKRFLSNFMQLVRKYGYQQACPYREKGKEVRANCAADEKFGQPDWVQPAPAAVIGGLVAAVQKGGSAWPAVKTTFTVTSQSTVLHYSINGGANATAPFQKSADGWAATVAVPFGSIVDLTAEVSQGPPIVRTGIAVDPAFDWQAYPPVRGDSAALDAMVQTIKL